LSGLDRATPALHAVDEYCREIEAYLCRKNDGHLIRIVGPSFERVSDWAARGVPLKVAFRGIDRYFERYYAKGARRRPVRIDFCEADVLDVFDEWKRAVGLVVAGAQTSEDDPEPRSSRKSLPEHLERVVLRLTQARANGSLGERFDDVIDRVATELDASRAGARGLRGAARHALIGRLRELDAELLVVARAAIDESTRARLARDADEELAAFRASMPPESFARAKAAALDRLVREKLALPTLAYDQP